MHSCLFTNDEVKLSICFSKHIIYILFSVHLIIIGGYISIVTHVFSNLHFCLTPIFPVDLYLNYIMSKIKSTFLLDKTKKTIIEISLNYSLYKVIQQSIIVFLCLIAPYIVYKLFCILLFRSLYMLLLHKFYNSSAADTSLQNFFLLQRISHQNIYK